ncbi:MAG: hypothetical protein A2802_02675 [Candidatus Woykebacteria bacterium RIFCSPHIGHO2_01_FULL_43_29]|uniref:Uncharacterized protein n=2 Tax=Candidatus Woykeibacteriota TaxID=1817899 RepID=A0A1G1WXS4_9BACT|nr:MAG: hypothetical protein A2802_02675 [Candidatus Woykebacteria bacterium RIFCSPHIGHO2_01_FULL_43_29]OGY29877.1 MAG: hypothetical protein A3J50_03930 [Candidatus Woykebacteria bacterium RIFCSPHIGHO2_02_FULL_43_16b]OGY32566.1 MAG: hypothetical protein A3A61_03210 [Candidatus Woykebacteria bacterium RIFCSPLOWO2_01_FULL_43_14]
MKKLILPALSLILGFGGIYYTVFFLPPYRDNNSLNFGNLALLLISAFSLLAPMLSLLVYYASLAISKVVKSSKLTWQIKVSRGQSFKRGVLLASFLVILGALQATKTNSFFNILLLIMILGLLETYSWRPIYGKK